MKSKLDHLRDFYNGKLYASIIGLLVVVGCTTGLEVELFAVVVASFLLGCCVAYDFRFALVPFLCTVFFVSIKNAPNITGFRDHFFQKHILITLGISFGLLIVGTIVFAIRNRRRRNAMPWKGFFLSMAIFCLGMALNGVFNEAYTVKNLLYALQFPAVLLLLYTVFALYVRFDESAFTYFMYALVVSGMVICLELVACYLFGNILVNGEIVRSAIALGWAVQTTIGGMIAFLMPACFYFAAVHKRGWIFYLLGLFEMLCILLSQSRGALLTGALVLLLSVIFLCVFGPNRRINRWITGGLVLLSVISVIFMLDKVLVLFRDFLTRGFDDNGRYYRWELGLDKFLHFPIFGAGFYDNGIVSDWDIQIYPELYHNTIIQVLASTGIIGTAAYLWHRVTTVMRVAKKPSLYKTYLGLCILACLAFCMLDVMLFITYPLIFYTVILLFMEKSDDPVQ